MLDISLARLYVYAAIFLGVIILGCSILAVYDGLSGRDYDETE